MWRHARDQKRKAEVFRNWLSQLQTQSPDVLLGANFASYGGVKGHLQAIQSYSERSIGFAPPDALLASGITPHDLQTTFREQFLNLQAPGIKSIHSHVFPWYIQWCRERQGNGIRWVHTYHNMYFPEFARGELEGWQRDINSALINQACHADVRISVSR